MPLIKALANVAGLKYAEVRQVSDSTAKFLIDAGMAVSADKLEDRNPKLAASLAESFDVPAGDAVTKASRETFPGSGVWTFEDEAPPADA